MENTVLPSHEVVGDFHLHTLFSDGSGTHDEVAAAATRAGLDVLAYTDHNVWTDRHTGWYTCPLTGRRLLRIMGEEVNDAALPRSINHYLCLGAGRDLHTAAPDPQALIDACHHYGGAGFIAHPIDRPAPVLPDSIAYPWLDWTVTGYSGIEVWNFGSEFKSQLTSLPRALLASFWPDLFTRGPFPDTLALWDHLNAGGHKVVAVGNSDAHASVIHLGWLKPRVLEYEYLFRTVHTHVLLDASPSTDGLVATQQVVRALQAGHTFVAYGRPDLARGFRFVSIGPSTRAGMGDEVRMEDGLALWTHVPRAAHIRLFRDGHAVATARGHRLHYPVPGPGVYRVEVCRAQGMQRLIVGRKSPTWILSNPVFVRA